LVIEHRLYTAGTSAKLVDLVDDRFPSHIKTRWAIYRLRAGPAGRLCDVCVGKRGHDVRRFEKTPNTG
jgi:hypothetical protein